MFIWAVLGAALFTASAGAATPDFSSRYYAVGFSREAPDFSWFALDSLGRGAVQANPLMPEGAVSGGLCFGTNAAGDFVYRLADAPKGAAPLWEVRCQESRLTLRSHYTGGSNLPPFRLRFNQKANHATLLGLMQPGERRTSLPCVLHLPDMGSARLTCNVRGAKLDYDARRYVKAPYVSVAFPAASARHPLVQYTLQVAAIYPHLRGIEGKARFDGFRRSFLNIFQVNPRVQMLANNSSSDPCSFTLFEYSEVALHAPPLAKGLSCLDLVRMTLERYLAGATGYGQVGYGKEKGGADLIPWTTPYTSLDTYPSLLIAACNYVQGAHDSDWARKHYAGLAKWAGQMMDCDHDGNGLIEYPASGNYGDRPRRERRPSNWWDTINFGHEDAYANALAYRACVLFSKVATQLGHKEDGQAYAAKAQRLRAAYLPAFLDPKTGVLAGWRSADGKLHDYWFTFVSGAAVACGVVDAKAGAPILDKLLWKMGQVGYTNFNLGLPGNLVPVRRGDYVYHNSPPQEFGEPRLEDGSDGFQYYENGGATACFSWFLVKALYQTGRVEQARRIFYPMLQSYAAGDFQGFCADGHSKDWRDWSGGCHGYEGLLVDGYLGLLAVYDELGVK